MTAPLPLPGLAAIASPVGQAQALLGAVGAVAPAESEVPPGLGRQLGAAMEVLPAAISFAETAWEGASALGAQESLATAASTLVDLGTSGVEIAGLTHQAAVIVIAGAAEVASIAAGFATKAAALLPAALSPPGQIAIVGLATEALSAALAVVERVKAELAGPTARMWAIAAELGTAPRARVPGTESPLGDRQVAYELAGYASGGNAGGEGAVSGESVAPGGSGVAGVAGGAGSLASVAGAGGDMGSGSDSSAASHSGSAAGAGSLDPAGGTAVTLPSGSVVTAPNPEAAAAVTNALGQQGVPYSWGGTTPGVGFDCSGLVQWAYGEAGVEIPRVAIDQQVGPSVPQDELLPGDLVVWDGHVAMFIGDGQMVEAGDPVQVSGLRTDNIGMQFLGFYRPSEAN